MVYDINEPILLQPILDRLHAAFERRLRRSLADCTKTERHSENEIVPVQRYSGYGWNWSYCKETWKHKKDNMQEKQ